MLYFFAREKFPHDRLDVDHWRAVDRVETLHVEFTTIDGEDLAYRYTEPVRAVFASLREDAGKRPIFSAAGVASPRLNLLWGYLVEEKDDLGMTEPIQAGERIGAKLGWVELDGRTALSPIIVDRIRPTAMYMSDCFDRICH